MTIALEEAEQFGPNDYRLAMTVAMLASVYAKQRKYWEAEPLFKRALAIQEARKDPNAAGILERLVEFYRAQGLFDEAYGYEERLEESKRLQPTDFRLLIAIERGDKSAVLSLLNKGASANAADAAGRTALGYAAINGQTDLIEEFLRRGADVNAQSAQGTTPLIAAGLFGDPEIVRMLIASGADVNAKEKGGETALSYAQGRLRNAPKERPERGSRGMLPYAARADYRIVVRLLTDAGAK